jgi:hypothetical protein
MIVRLTKMQVLRLKYKMLEQLDNAGYDGDRPEFNEYARILDALDEAELEEGDKVQVKRR